MGSLFGGKSSGVMSALREHSRSGAGYTGASSPLFEGSTQHTGVDLSARQQAVAPAGTMEGTPAGKRRRGRGGLGAQKTGLAGRTVMSNTY